MNDKKLILPKQIQYKNQITIIIQKFVLTLMEEMDKRLQVLCWISDFICKTDIRCSFSFYFDNKQHSLYIFNLVVNDV